MRQTAGVCCSDRRVTQIAETLLQKGASATDVCVASFLAASAFDPGMLLGPVFMLVAGTGIGVHGYDGAVVQPGRGAPRPRGFREQDAIPAGAYVGAPSGLHTLVAAHAQHGRLTLSELAAPAVRAANAAGAQQRAASLRKVSEMGALMLRSPTVLSALLEAAGRVNGGNLTEEDIAELKAGSHQPNATDRFVVPSFDNVVSPVVPLRPFVACVCDIHNGFGVLHAASDMAGIEIPELELVAPRLAVPVRRGVSRITPGQLLRIPAPVGILRDNEVPWAAVGFEATCPVDMAPLCDSTAQGLSLEQSARNALANHPGARSACTVVRLAGKDSPVHAVRVTTEP